MTPTATTQSRNGHLLGLLDRRSYFGGAVQIYGCIAALLFAGLATTKTSQGAPFVLLVELAVACIAAFRYAERDPTRLASPGAAPAIQTLARLIGTNRATFLPVVAGVLLLVVFNIGLRWLPSGVLEAIVGDSARSIGVMSIAAWGPFSFPLIGLPLVAIATRTSRWTLVLLALGSAASLGVLATLPIDSHLFARCSAPLLLGTIFGAGIRTRWSTWGAKRVEEDRSSPTTRDAGPQTRSAWRSVAIVSAMAIVVLLGDCQCHPIETGTLSSGGVGIAAVLATILLGAPATPLLVNRIGAPLLLLAIDAMKTEGGGLWLCLTQTIAGLALFIEAVELGLLGKLIPTRILTDLVMPGGLLLMIRGGVSSQFDTTIGAAGSSLAVVLSAQGAACAVGAVGGALFRADALVFVTGFVCKPLALLAVLVPASLLQFVPLRTPSGSDRPWISGILAGFVAPWLVIPIVGSLVFVMKIVMSILTASFS